ncbi:transposase [Streptomyces sioyaensis]|uniref:transposase n=1 Tax=Streptomyces sioyaensis TaxID=67364 RepID=UPI0037A52295
MPGAAWQRCRVHFLRNVFGVIDKESGEMVAATIRMIVWLPGTGPHWTCRHPRERPGARVHWQERRQPGREPAGPPDGIDRVWRRPGQGRSCSVRRGPRCFVNRRRHRPVTTPRPNVFPVQ